MPDEPLNIKDFAARIKATHPDYAEVEDHELAYRVLDKFPDYRSSISLPKLTRARTNEDHINNIRTLNPEFADTAQGFLDFASQRGLSDAYIKSGYRTAKEQNDIFKGPRGKFTKGNDGYENISPHQEARGTDWSTKDPANKPLLHTLIRAYARKKKLHVPIDEPWHMAGSRGTQSPYLARIRALLDSPSAASQLPALSTSEPPPKPSQSIVKSAPTLAQQPAQMSPMGDTQLQPPKVVLPTETMDAAEQGVAQEDYIRAPQGVSGFTGNVGRILDQGPHAEAAYREFLQRNVPQVKGKAVSSDELLKDETLATVFTKIQDFVQANPKAKPREQARALAQMGVEFLKDPATSGKQLPRVLHVALLESKLDPQEMGALPRVLQRQIQEHQGRQAAAQKQQAQWRQAIAGAKKQMIAETEEMAKYVEPARAEKMIAAVKNASEKQVIQYAKNRRLIDENTLGQESSQRFQRDADWMRKEVAHTQGLARQVLTGQEHQKIVKEELSRQGPGLKPLPERLQKRGVPVEATYKILAPTQAEIAERRLESLPRAAQAPVAAAWDFLSGQAHRVANLFDVMSGEIKFEGFYDESVKRMVKSGGGRERASGGAGKPILPESANQAMKDIGAFFRTQSEQLAQGAKAVSDENEGNFFTYTLPHSLTTAGLTLIELATLKKATGASLGTVFGASTFVDTLDLSAKEQRSATMKAYLLGTFFDKLPEAALKPLLEKLPLGKKLGDWIAGASEKRLQRLAGAPIGAAVGGGLAYESGKSKEGIIADSLIWAGIGGIPELVGLAKKAPEKVIASARTPEPVREVVGKATGKRPVVLQSEGENPRFASVYVDPKTGEQIPREVTAAEASSLLSKDRPARIVPKEQFEQVFGSKAVAPEKAQLATTTEVKDAGTGKIQPEAGPPDTAREGLVPREGALERGSGPPSLRGGPEPEKGAQGQEIKPLQGEGKVAQESSFQGESKAVIPKPLSPEGLQPEVSKDRDNIPGNIPLQTHFKGDRAEYTGREETIAGGKFYAVKMLEGQFKGQEKLVKAPPSIPESQQEGGTQDVAIETAAEQPKLTDTSVEGAGGISGDTPAPSITIPLDQLKRSELKQRVRQGGARAQEYQQELDRRYESRGLAQFVRDSGGIAPGEMYAGELARLSPKETGTTGLINKNARTGSQRMSLEYMMDAANEEGFRDLGGNKFEHPGDFAMAIESELTGGRKGYIKLTSGDEVDYVRGEAEYFKSQQEEHDVDAAITLLESDQAGVFYDKISEGTASETDLQQFRKYAEDLGISSEATENLIASARAEGVPEAPQVQVPSSARAEQLGFVQEGLEQQSAPPPKLPDQRERLLREEQERQAALNPERTAALKTLAEIRAKGMTVDDYARQGSLIGETPSPEKLKLLRELESGEKRASSGGDYIPLAKGERFEAVDVSDPLVPRRMKSEAKKRNAQFLLVDNKTGQAVKAPSHEAAIEAAQAKTREEAQAILSRARPDRGGEAMARPEGTQGAGAEPRGAEIAAGEPSPEEPSPTAEESAPEEPGQPQPDDKAYLPVAMPELVELAKAMLGGKYPQIAKQLRVALGMFKAQEGLPETRRILINPKTAKNEWELAQVLAHEIGHLNDFLPEGTLKRGNILGRIAVLRGYLKHYVEGFPGGPPPLTDKERARLHREAVKLARKDIEKEIDEEIVQTTPITPKDILDIWNSYDQGQLNPGLLIYIKELNTAEKKSIVLAALKGVVREDLQRFAATSRIKTGRRITITEPATGDIAAAWQKLITEEIRKRQLLSLEVVKTELIDLTKWWSGDYGRADKEYRESSKELYAEALSVFLNAPQQLKLRAPMFYRGLTAYMERKPEFSKKYIELQALLNGTPEQLAEARARRIDAMFTRGDEKVMAAFEAQRATRLSVFESVRQFLEQYILDVHAPIAKRTTKLIKGGMTIRDDDNAMFVLDELNTIDNVNHIMLAKVQRDIYQPLLDAGVSRTDIGEFLLLRRVVNERNEIANPLGFTPSAAGEQLMGLKNRLGDARFATLEAKMQQFHEIVFDASTRAVKEGVYNQKLYDETIVPNKDNYAAFGVIKYLETHMPAAIRKQIGTFEEVANPLDATIMKMITLNRLIELTCAQHVTIDFLKQNYSDEVRHVEIPYGATEPKRPAKPGFEYLYTLEDGKWNAYEIPKEVALGFRVHDVGGLARFANIIQGYVYKVFHPLYVSFNPGFLAANPFRDFRRTATNLGAIGTRLHKDLVARLMERGFTKEGAKVAASPQKITLGQVLWAYWKALPPSYRRARGVDDALIEQMFSEHALTTPFVDVAGEAGEDVPLHRLLKQHGLIEEKHSKHMALRIWRGLLDTVEAAGVLQETMSKVAGFNLLSERGVSPRERAYMVRKYVGTPDFKQKGLWTPVSNTVWMYSRVRWNGMQADLRLGIDPKTRAGWWWRHMTWNFLPRLFTRLAIVGVFGAGVAEIMKRIPDYFKDSYDIIPLGTVHSDGKEKSLFLTIPPDDLGQTTGAIFGRMLDEAFNLSGHETSSRSGGQLAQASFGDLTAQLFPNVNPIFDITSKWSQFAKGRNPYDDHFNETVVPRAEWEAGGWYSSKKMLSWTVNKFGVVGTLVQPLSDQFLGAPLDTGDPMTAEILLHGVPGVSRLVRISDKGISESEWLEIEHDDQEKARFKLGLPPEIRKLTVERFRLTRQKAIRELTIEEEARRAVVNKWYAAVYVPLTDKIRAAEEKSEDTTDLRATLQKVSNDVLKSDTGGYKEFSEAEQKARTQKPEVRENREEKRKQKLTKSRDRALRRVLRPSSPPAAAEPRPRRYMVTPR